VREPRAHPGGDIGLHGSIQLAQALLEAELVDELQLVVGPAIGLPAGGCSRTPKTSVGSSSLSAMPTPSGSVALAYRLPREAPIPAG
jgi:riboflavin biosynthesis pyrimidine reductase